MTLMVGTFRYDSATGHVRNDPIAEGGASLAGVEVWRTLVWGSEAAKRRGATFLPQLATGDLHVLPDELPAFREECRRLLADVDAFAREAFRDPAVDGRDIAFRLRSFLAAADRADPVCGGVYIG